IEHLASDTIIEQTMGKEAYAVFEGGGVKGTALVGAIAKTFELGYTFSYVAGTSAGAIVASLIAAGYKATELKNILDGVDYLKFMDEGPEDKIPLVGKVVSIISQKGIYEGDYFESWLRDLLARKNVKTFRDLRVKNLRKDARYPYSLQVIASDVSRGKLLVLPGDFRDYGLNPDDVEVARAVRMSMSIPYFYEPATLPYAGGKSFIVDGGILSNFPVWIYDEDPMYPEVPTFGYKLVDPDEGRPHKIDGPVSLFDALFATMMEAHDARYIEDADFMRAIPIPTLGVQTTDFNISSEKKGALYSAGYEAAEKFFASWNFETYKRKLVNVMLRNRRNLPV